MLASFNGAVTAGADFTAGFMFGMTGDNHLTEIEACYNGGTLMAQEVEFGIADIKKGGMDNDLQGALQFGLAILQIPQALSTCEGMTDDINAIEAWAQIFTNPTELAATISKHFVFHKAEIQSDITKVETAWNSQQYFEAGEDLADLMTLAIGPIQSSEDALPPLNAAPDFVAGLIYGFTGDNHLDELRTCMGDSDELAKDGQKALADIKALHLFSAVQDFGQVIWDLPDAVADCQGMDEDIAAIEQWAVIFKEPVQLSKTVSKNWLFHGPAIKKDIRAQKADWEAQNFFMAGQDAAKVIEGLVGPVEK